jgi:membrane protein
MREAHRAADTARVSSRRDAGHLPDVSATVPRERTGPARALAVDGRRDDTGLVRRFADAASANALSVFASAVSFRILFALVPFALFGIALLGFLSLDEVWRDSVAPEVRERTSGAAFTLVDQSAERILTTREGLWLTVGAALALWEVSAAIRVTRRALDRIHGESGRRPLRERLVVSLGLSVPLSACFLGAVAAAQLLPPMLDRRGGGLVGDVAARVLGWSTAAVLVVLAIALLLRFAPASPRPFRIAGAASVFVVVCWTVTSALYGLYVTKLASYDSLFGSLAFVIVLIAYVYVSALTFLGGLQLEALVGRKSPAGGGTSSPA